MAKNRVPRPGLPPTRPPPIELVGSAPPEPDEGAASSLTSGRRKWSRSPSAGAPPCSAQAPAEAPKILAPSSWMLVPVSRDDAPPVSQWSPARRCTSPEPWAAFTTSAPRPAPQGEVTFGQKLSHPHRHLFFFPLVHSISFSWDSTIPLQC